MRANSRVARLSIHAIMPPGNKVLGREGVRMVISCDSEDGPAASTIRLRRR
jgi:hypothetical protein